MATFAATRDTSLILESHQAGCGIGYCHIKKLLSLKALLGDGFTIACFPVKICGTSVGWARAVAIFDV